MQSVISQGFGAFYTRALARPVEHKGELLSVQRLRGVAVLMVIIVHIEDVARHFPGWADVHTAYSRRLGYSAADLFFVISGFIMAYITFSRPFEARSWAISRIVRIYPMYMLFSSLVVLMWLYDPRMTMGTGEQNWHRILVSLAAIPQAGLPLLFVGWTVEHEVVFYSVVFFTACVLGRERLYAVMSVLAVLSLVRWLLMHATGAELWDWHLTSLYMVQFTIGVLIHRHWTRLSALGWKWPLLGFACGLTAGLLWSESGRISEETPVRVLSFGLAYGCLLLSMLNLERERRAAGWHERHRDVLVWLGDISYSIYLTHPFVLGTCGKVFPFVGTSVTTQWLSLGIAAAMTLGVGVATHVLIERPVMEFGRRVSRSWRRSPQPARP